MVTNKSGVRASGISRVKVSLLSDDDPTAQAVIDEAGPELDNAGLRAAIAVQLEDVRASRERIYVARMDAISVVLALIIFAALIAVIEGLDRI